MEIIKLLFNEWKNDDYTNKKTHILFGLITLIAIVVLITKLIN